MIRRALFTLLAVPFAVACGSSASEDVSVKDGPSTMSGSIALTAYTLDNPVVIARTAQGTSFVAPVSRDGRFRLVLPATDHYRFVLASTLPDGSYRAVSELRWGTERTAWGSFAGRSIDVGTVRPIGTAGGVRTASRGSGSDGEASASGSGSSSETETDTESGGDSPEAESCYKPGKADLPYDAQPGVGDTWKLLDAFLEKGAPPKAVLDVTMEGGGAWRLAELKSGAAFTITQADCDHQGNRDVGRDRIFVTWENSDGSKSTDHLDMRYCKGGGGGGGSSSSAPVATGVCTGGEGSACGDSATGASECDVSMHPEHDSAEPLPACPAGGGGAGAAGAGATAGADGANATGAGGTGAAGSASGGGAAGAGTAGAGGISDAGGACVTSANCGANLACFASVCVSTLR